MLIVHIYLKVIKNELGCDLYLISPLGDRHLSQPTQFAIVRLRTIANVVGKIAALKTSSVGAIGMIQSPLIGAQKI